ncbi:disease resistance protein RGA5 [Aegilops tauschii subsp. strangulata]|uniref:Disease resistance protein RPM1 n=3 Tax=Aegilops tauschii subsp. strangulata TaxID=200361 RepID=A0A453MM01_AEGTS|nr:disease resistance protein RGA5 [Aegilops tauschii subsp. strangulata]
MAVVSAAHGAFGPLLGKLTALLADECGRLKGVRREIRSLRSELASMHAALKEYTKLDDPSDQVKAWISLVRELAYDTEDVFDKFIHHLGDSPDHGGFKELFRKAARRLKTLGARHGIAGEIHDLKDRIRQVKELKDCYKLPNNAPSSTAGPAAVDPRLHALFADEAHLVGIDGPRDHLAKWMLEEANTSPKHCKVLSIVGFGGLGKTTLANEVCREIQGEFDCKAFVSVSQKPDIKKIIKDVISQVSCQGGSTKDDTTDWDEMKSISELRVLLQNKRYLIIIDDVWSTQAWHAIKCAFPENDCSSRIIATTRIIDVAKSCCLSADDRVYELEALSDPHSRRLFFKRLFRSEEDCPEMLKEVSNKILKKCGGLPLAIISISGLLANRPAIKEEWEKVKRSIGTALEKTNSLEGMSSILSLSYNDLAPHLKTCLLYLSLFPEDHLIYRDMLVRRWIAEGFISEERGQSKQEVAENYFYELINKSMVQPVGIGYDGKVGACRVHDMMLEIIISKSAEDNFTTVVGGGQTSLLNHQDSIRRLSIQHIDKKLASELANVDLSHVRTLIVMPSCCITHLPSLDRFEALRVLDFEGCVDLKDCDMKGMDKLFQLKYLSFRGTGISKLPAGIVMLGNLETLEFMNTDVEELPAGITRLTELQHLNGYLNKHLPNGIGGMRNLQLMPKFIITSQETDVLEDLGNLTSLEELNVNLGRNVSCEDKRCEKEAFLSSLCKLGNCKLRSLLINAYGGSLDFSDSWSPLPSSLQSFWAANRDSFTNVPKWITPELINLADLLISLTELTEDGLLTLGQLPSLLRLRLWPSKKFVGTVQATSFPNLKVLSFRAEQVYVSFVKGSAPKLEEISRMPFSVSAAKANKFYLGIHHLSCLKRAHILLDDEDATPSECKAAAAAIRKEADINANHPAVTFPGEPKEEDNEETVAGEEEKSNEDGDADED